MRPAELMAIELRVEAEHEAERADRFITNLLVARGLTVSRATVQRWIRAGRVVSQGVILSDPAAKLRATTVLVVFPLADPATTATPDASIVIDVVFEDEDILVVNKPAGLVVHPARGNWSGTLVNGLLGRDVALANGELASDLVRPGIVHRLDKGTSGVMVVAKNAHARERLKVQLAAHAVEREYVAIVAGVAHDATIETLHGRDPRDRLRFTSFVREGKRAVTHVRVLERFANATYVACTLETGRTHQIRVHLAERMKTPILGDPLYGAPPRDTLLSSLANELGRQALHARLLGLEHPRTSLIVRFERPVPEDMQRVLARLRGPAPAEAEPRAGAQRKRGSKRH